MLDLRGEGKDLPLSPKLQEIYAAATKISAKKTCNRVLQKGRKSRGKNAGGTGLTSLGGPGTSKTNPRRRVFLKRTLDSKLKTLYKEQRRWGKKEAK